MENKVTDYDFILGLDIALKRTGVALYDLKKGGAVLLDYIDATTPTELCKGVERLFIKNTHVLSGRVLVLRESLPKGQGRFTDINTLQGLAKAHAAVDIALECLVSPTVSRQVEQYRSTISPATVRAVYKALNGIPANDKEAIDKDAIGLWVGRYVHDTCKPKYFELMEQKIYDPTDALGLVVAFLERKYVDDLKEDIKEEKRKIKKYKAAYAIANSKDAIGRISILIDEHKDFMSKGGVADVSAGVSTEEV